MRLHFTENCIFVGVQLESNRKGLYLVFRWFRRIKCCYINNSILTVVKSVYLPAVTMQCKSSLLHLVYKEEQKNRTEHKITLCSIKHQEIHSSTANRSSFMFVIYSGYNLRPPLVESSPVHQDCWFNLWFYTLIESKNTRIESGITNLEEKLLIFVFLFREYTNL